MSILIFIISFFIMNIVNKYILKERNLYLAIGISLVSFSLFLKLGWSFEFFKVFCLTFVLAVIGWIDFKTQDVYFFHIMIGAIIGVIFIALDIFKTQNIQVGFFSACMFLVFLIILGFIDYSSEREGIIFLALVCIYLLYFLGKGDTYFMNILSACIIPSLVIGVLALLGGMGWGDVEIIFICGLFLSFKMALFNLFIGIVLGGMYAIYLIVFKKKANERIAFGPFIAMGTGFTLLFGEQILTWYINFL